VSHASTATRGSMDVAVRTSKGAAIDPEPRINAVIPSAVVREATRARLSLDAPQAVVRPIA
jgi:hypothetical protein